MKRGSLLTGLLVAVFFSAAWPVSAASERRYALRGPDAAAFQLPSDMALAKTLPIRADRLSWARYQQRFGAAAVLGAQLTLLRDVSGRPVAVIGRRSLGITPANSVRLTAAQFPSAGVGRAQQLGLLEHRFGHDAVGIGAAGPGGRGKSGLPWGPEYRSWALGRTVPRDRPPGSIRDVGEHEGR